jgi:hypothetical protein
MAALLKLNEMGNLLKMLAFLIRKLSKGVGEAMEE